MSKSPSVLHQGLIDLVRGDPAFVIGLVYRAAGLLPVSVEVRDLGADARVPSPFGDDRHLRPDMILGVHVAGELRELWLGEAQLHRANHKLDIMSAARAATQLHKHVPTFHFALSPKPTIRRWPERASRGDSSDPPVIVEPHHFPVLTSADAGSRPHACLLRAFFCADDFAALRVGLEATRVLSVPDRQRYTAMLLNFTEPTMSEALEALLRELEADDDPEPDEWDRSRAGWHRAYREGAAEGEARGQAKARAEALIDILELRGFSIDEARRASILACSNLAELERWYARAKQAGSLAEVFL